MNSSTVMVTAYSRAPKNTAMYENNRVFGLVLLIDRETNIIEDAEATVITNLAKKFLHGILVGVNFKEDITPVIETIKDRYLAPSQNAMIVALKTAHQRYNDIN